MLVGEATVLVSVGTMQVDGATLRVGDTTVCGCGWSPTVTSVAKWVLVHWLSLQGVRSVTTAGKMSSWSVTLLRKLYIVKFGGRLNIFTVVDKFVRNC